MRTLSKPNWISENLSRNRAPARNRKVFRRQPSTKLTKANLRQVLQVAFACILTSRGFLPLLPRWPVRGGCAGGARGQAGRFYEVGREDRRIATRRDSASADLISNIELKFAFDLITGHRIG